MPAIFNLEPGAQTDYFFLSKWNGDGNLPNQLAVSNTSESNLGRQRINRSLGQFALSVLLCILGQGSFSAAIKR